MPFRAKPQGYPVLKSALTGSRFGNIGGYTSGSRYNGNIQEHAQRASEEEVRMRDGLYKITFPTPANRHDFNTGVFVLRRTSEHGGELRGGDSAMYYIGSFTDDGRMFSALINVKVHSHATSAHPVAGLDEFQFKLEAPSFGSGSEKYPVKYPPVRGSAEWAAGNYFKAALEWLSD
jgi:hypothetical protein